MPDLGNSTKAADLAERYIKKHGDDIQNLDANKLFLLGQFHVDLAQFSEAVELLSQSIEKDPSNLEAYFYRATAYFELGEFDKSLQDYLSSNRILEIPKSATTASIEFTQALIGGLCRGGIETATDFIPSSCSTIYGLGEALWVTANNPIEALSDFASICYEVSQNVYEHCANIDWETIDGYAYEVRYLCDNFMQLSVTEKGDMIGFILSKYGTEILAGKMACNGIAAYRNLQNANRVCNFESMALSSANKESIIQLSLKHKAEREGYFQKVKVQWDKQSKHIPGKHNYINGRGYIELNEANLESLILSKAGTGQKVVGEVGVPVYKERIDFGQIIGKYAIEIKGEPTQYVPTSKGILIYAKDGVHVVPSNPTSVIQ